MKLFEFVFLVTFVAGKCLFFGEIVNKFKEMFTANKTIKANDWNTCEVNSIIKVNSLNVKQEEGDAVLEITAEGMEAVENGRVEYQMKKGNMVIYENTADICEILSKKGSGTQCPVPKGPISLTMREKIPEITPGGNYKFIAKGETATGRSILCLEIDIDYS